MVETTTTIDKVETEPQALAKDTRFITRGGWFQPSEISVHCTRLFPPPAFTRRNQGSRAYVYNAYSYVPLRLMAKQARTQGLKFNTTTINRKYPLQYRDVVTVQRLINTYARRVDANAHDNAVRWGNSGLAAETLPTGFRRNFCHYSANESSVGNVTRWVSHRNAYRKRKIFPGRDDQPGRYMWMQGDRSAPPI